MQSLIRWQCPGLELDATQKQLADEDFALEHLRMRDWIAYSMRRLMELNRDVLAGRAVVPRP